MNKEKFKNYMFEEFPTVFNNHFSITMFLNILDYAENFTGYKQQEFLLNMIPEIDENDLKHLY